MDTILLPDTTVVVPPDGLSIGEVATATGLSVQTLRYYESEGLMLDLTPRDGGGRRRYSQHDVAWLAGLIMLRETGMPIAQMRVIAELSRRPGTEAARLDFFEGHRRMVLDHLEQTKRHLAAIDAKIAAYRKVADGEESV